MTLRTTLALAVCALALGACNQAPAAETAGAATADDAASTEMPEVTLTRTKPVSDQLLTCAEKKDNGITITQFFLIHQGEVKSYSQMQNHARQMCDPGQAGCALGWQGEKVALYFKTNSGAVNRMTVDVDTLDFSKTLVSATSGTEAYAGKCTSAPLPEGVTID